MQAYLLHKAGGIDNLILSEIDKPTPKADEVPHVFKTFTFTKLHDAHRQVETNHTVGKVVVEV